MLLFTKMDLIHDYMCRGAMIKWVGYNGPRMVEVHMFHNEDVVIETIQLEKDYTDETFEKLFSSSASEPGSVTGTIWSSDNRLELLRLASILGLNPGAQAIPGAGQAFRGKLGCVMAYDIEQDRTRLSNSSFPTPSESITCIATYCSCGETRLFSFIQGVDFDYTQCSSSQETVSHFIDYVTVHSPQWLVGYNNFRYDNTCIAFHANKRYDNIFVSMRVGAGSSLSYAFYLDIPGVYNIDLLTYLDKTRRGTYTNMSLATLVKHHGIDEKMTYDTADYTDLVRLFEYNLHDSMITMKLAFETNSIVEITTLAVVTCSPIIDCVRFVSGTLAACSVASYCLANKIRMDWSPCLEVMEYRGAEVLKPVTGLHENVVLCDFSSMYPTVLMGSNISIENQSEVSSSSPSGAVSITENSSVFTIGSKDISFCSKTKCIMPPVMKLFVDKRRMVRKSNPSYALALKVAANSIYGSLGDRHSRIYSPNCSAAVTTGGRWCLATAEMILKMMGYAVVYGDTDSCFIAPTEKIRTDVNTATAVLSRIFLFSPFPGMSMEVENTYSKIAFLGKKTYFGKTTDGKIVSKGMSRSRKDRIGICRTLSALVVPTILSDMPIADRRRTIGDMLSLSVDYVVTNSLSLQQVSKIVKRGGTNYYEYRTDTDQRDWRDCESCTGLEMVPYSAGRVVKSIRSEIESILAITKLGNMATMMRSSDII